jgi:hypothetical protein
MRVVRVRALVPSLGGLMAGFLASMVAALLLKVSVPDAELIWNMVSPLRVAAWILQAAHGVPTDVRSAAGVVAPDAPGSVGRLSELLGSGPDVVFSFSLLLVPLTILAVVGITVALLVRRSDPSTTRQVLERAAICAATHGIALAVVAWASSFEFVAEGKLAPELGLGAASGHVAIGIGHRPLVALLIGAAWGAAFAAAGGLSALRMRGSIASDDRIVLLAWMRGLGTASAIWAGLLLLGGIGAAVTGHAPKPSLVGLGALLLSGNATAAGLLASSGVSMAVSLDAGPFTGWERMDLLNVGASGDAAPPYVWLALAIPLAAGVVAGRFARRRSSLPGAGIAVRYGVLWGLSLAVLALLLRVRVLSSFSVGGLDLGGGGAAFDPLVALVCGAAVGTIAAFIGTRTVATRTSSDETWSCPACGIVNARSDRFCVSCGAGQAPGSQSGA